MSFVGGIRGNLAFVLSAILSIPAIAETPKRFEEPENPKSALVKTIDPSIPDPMIIPQSDGKARLTYASLNDILKELREAKAGRKLEMHSGECFFLPVTGCYRYTNISHPSLGETVVYRYQKPAPMIAPDNLECSQIFSYDAVHRKIGHQVFKLNGDGNISERTDCEYLLLGGDNVIFKRTRTQPDIPTVEIDNWIVTNGKTELIYPPGFSPVSPPPKRNPPKPAPLPTFLVKESPAAKIMSVSGKMSHDISWNFVVDGHTFSRSPDTPWRGDSPIADAQKLVSSCLKAANNLKKAEPVKEKLKLALSNLESGERLLKQGYEANYNGLIKGLTGKKKDDGTPIRLRINDVEGHQNAAKFALNHLKSAKKKIDKAKSFLQEARFLSKQEPTQWAFTQRLTQAIELSDHALIGGKIKIPWVEYNAWGYPLRHDTVFNYIGLNEPIAKLEEAVGGK